MNRRILIVGCGQLGSRHLQAVATLPEVQEIDVVDPRPEALSVGQQRVEEVVGKSASLKIRWLTSLDQVQHPGDLCIIATQAEGRVPLLQRVAEDIGYSSFLIEKIVAQSVVEYQQLLNFSKQKGLTVWVNLKSRAHPSHQRVKAQLNPDDPILYSVVGGNHGLANNGVHAVDLFMFFEGSQQLQLEAAAIDPELLTSKRGPHVFDLSGTLQGRNARGSHFTLSFAKDHMSPITFTLASRTYRAVIDDAQQWFYESTAASNWNWKPVPFQALMTVSHMSRQFVSDIFATGTCQLPTLQEAFPAHYFILTALQPHFQALLKTESELCPVT